MFPPTIAYHPFLSHIIIHKLHRIAPECRRHMWRAWPGAHANSVAWVGDVLEAVAVRVPLASAGGDAGGLAHAGSLERLAATHGGAHVAAVSSGAGLQTLPACGIHA